MDPTSATYTFDPASSTLESPAFTFDPSSSANGIASSGAVFSVGGEEETAVQTSDHYVLESTTLKAGEAATISGHVISAAPSILIVDSMAVPLSALPSTGEDPKPSVVAIGGLTSTASALPGESQAAAVGTHTLSLGGPAVTISGQTITHASEGLAILSGSQAVALTAIDPSLESSDPAAVSSKPSGQIEYVADSVTVKASTPLGSGHAIVIDGTTVSQDGPAITANGHILTLDSSGLILADPHSTAPFTAVSSLAYSKGNNGTTWAFDSLTVTAVPVDQQTKAVSLAGTTLSQGGEAVEVDGATLTVGSSGLEVIKPGTTAAMSKVSEQLPVIVGLTSSLPSNSSVRAPSPSMSPVLSTATTADVSGPTSSESGGSKTTADLWRLAVVIAIAIMWLVR